MDLQKTAGYMPKMVRPMLDRLKTIAKKYPGRAGVRYDAFAKTLPDEEADTIQKLLSLIGLDKHTKRLKFRGIMPSTMGVLGPLSPDEAKGYGLKPTFKDAFALRRTAYDPNSRMAKDIGSMRSVKLTSRTPLFTGAPGNSLALNEVYSNRGPGVDILLSDKYLQKGRNGKALLDPDIILPEYLQKRFHVRNYVAPFRAQRLYTSDMNAGNPDIPYSAMQAVREANGKIDDVAGLILYPKAYNRGYMFTTGTAETPFTDAALKGGRFGAFRRYNKERKGVENAVRKVKDALKWMDPRRGIDAAWEELPKSIPGSIPVKGKDMLLVRGSRRINRRYVPFVRDDIRKLLGGN